MDHSSAGQGRTCGARRVVLLRARQPAWLGRLAANLLALQLPQARLHLGAVGGWVGGVWVSGGEGLVGLGGGQEAGRGQEGPVQQVCMRQE